MKFLVLFALLAVAAAAPKRQVRDVLPIRILKAGNEFNEDFSYKFDFESEDGIKREESGAQKLIDPQDPESIGTVMRGSYTYTHEGVTYTVTWVADENGFQPSGAHLPVAPVA